MIFGTHNSGTYGSLQGCCTNILLPWTQNQTLTFEEQLDAGIQWFDLRVTYSTDDGNLYVSHSVKTENRLAFLLLLLAQRLQQRSDNTFCILHLRVDYQDRSNAAVIAPIMEKLLNTTLASYLCTKKDVGEAGSMSEATRQFPNRVFLYCADGTIQNPYVCSMDLMPCVSFWDAGTVEEMERRLQTMDARFMEQQNGPFVFSRDRMLLFDYSTQAPLWWTDRQQEELMKKYKETIEGARITVLAGNHIQRIAPLFR